jgi:hypothetical protein
MSGDLGTALKHQEPTLLTMLIAHEVLLLLVLAELQEVSVHLVLRYVDEPRFGLAHFLLAELLAQVTEVVLSQVVLVQRVLVVEGFVVAELAYRMVTS